MNKFIAGLLTAVVFGNSQTRLVCQFFDSLLESHVGMSAANQIQFYPAPFKGLSTLYVAPPPLYSCKSDTYSISNHFPSYDPRSTRMEGYTESHEG